MFNIVLINFLLNFCTFSGIFSNNSVICCCKLNIFHRFWSVFNCSRYFRRVSTKCQMEEFPASGACALDHCLGEQMLIIGDAKTQCLGHWPTIQWVPKFLSIIWHTFPAVFIQFHPQLNNFSISLQQFSHFPANIFTSFSTPFHSVIFHQKKWYNLI